MALPCELPDHREAVRDDATANGVELSSSSLRRDVEHIQMLCGISRQCSDGHANPLAGLRVAEAEFAVGQVIVTFETRSTHEAVDKLSGIHHVDIPRTRGREIRGSHLRTVVVTAAVRGLP